jgi:hypothetical protein
MPLPKLPVRVDFDPADNPGTAPLWALPAGRILMLLWRPTHLCGADWFRDALKIARNIQHVRPQNTDQLVKCFFPARGGEYFDFTIDDVDAFCSASIDYFAGRDSVPYAGEVSGLAAME